MTWDWIFLLAGIVLLGFYLYAIYRVERLDDDD